LAASLWHGYVAGAYTGVLFSLGSFAFYGSVSAPFTFGLKHAVLSYVYTVAVHSVTAGIIGAALGLLLWIVSKPLGFIRGRVYWTLLVFPFAALLPFVFVNARWQTRVPRNVSLFDPYRIEFLQRSLVYCLAAGLALSILLAVVFYGRECWRRSGGIHAAFAIATAAVTVLTLADMHLLHGRVEWRNVESVAEAPLGDQNVILVGLDGATWTVLKPMIERGDLPNMREFMQEAAYGPLQVYGKAFSPSVWTTMVTGVKRSVHGIVSYTVTGQGGTYMAGSEHRKVPAVWNIVDAAGLYSGLVNYMVTYPPEHIRGINFSRIVPIGAIPYEEKIWPAELAPRVAELVESVPKAEGADAHAADLNREVTAIIELFESFFDPSYKFFAVYTHTTDDAEHRYWSYLFPEDFRGSPLEPAPEDVAAKGSALLDHYRRVDRLFEFLNSISDPQTSVIVVSDHGMESAKAPEAHLSLNALLEEMGLLARTADGDVDTSRTAAYWPSGSDINMRATGIKIAPGGIESVFGAGVSFEEARGRVIERLRRIRLERAGKPLFSVVLPSEEEKDRLIAAPLSGSDIIVHLSAFTRGAAYDDVLDLGGREVPMKDVLVVKGDVTGAHHPRGIIMARGAPFRKGPAFARPTTETPFSDMLERALGRSPRLDPITKLAQFLGLVDRATTLDIAQTALYLMGLPCAQYMQGRVLVEAMERSYVSEHWGALIQDYGAASRRPQRESAPSPEELERLRSLGYVD